MTQASPASFENTARVAAREAGAILRNRFRPAEGIVVERKGLHDFVTAVDREAEDALTSTIRRVYPDHAIMAEEGSPDTVREGYRWIIDPLDGTTNFIHGVPTFCVSVALEDADGLLAGAIYDPLHDEMFHAARGCGAHLNGSPIECGGKRDLNDTLIATGFPFRTFAKVDGYLATLREFMETTSGIRRAGSAALDLAFTACGRYDGFFEVGLSPWDVAAGALLVREAGGVVTDCGGGDRFLTAGEIVAAGPEIHAVMLDVTHRRLA